MKWVERGPVFGKSKKTNSVCRIQAPTCSIAMKSGCQAKTSGYACTRMKKPSMRWSRSTGLTNRGVDLEKSRTRPMSLIEEDVIMRAMLWLLVSIFAASFAGGASEHEIDWKKVDEAAWRTAAVSSDVHRYGFPRTDLTVTLDGLTIRPTLALGGWAAFKPAHGGAMVMGDLVLLETEVNPVMAKLIENGIDITAVHNHVLRANPAT